jgi:putative ABC transport system permease protein
VWGVKLLVALAPDTISQLKAVEIDARALGFTLAVSVITGMVFGLAPALQVSKTNLNDSLKEGSRGGTSDPRRSRIRNLLVVSEVALAMVLLAGAGLMINSFVRLNRVQAGFNPDRLLTMRMNLPQSKYSNQNKRIEFYDSLLDRVRRLPGVESAAMITFLPLTFPGGSSLFTAEGRPAPPAGEEPLAVTRSNTPDYFRTMGISLITGRVFDQRDRQDSQPVAVINRAMAERYWPGEDPVGRRLKIGYASSNLPWLTIVGIVGDVRQFELTRESKPEMYTPHTQQGGWFAPRDFVVRTSSDPLSFAAAVRSQVLAVDPDQPVYDVRSMEQVLSDSISRERFNTTLFGVFALVAMMLAAVGIYGVMSYTVTQRTHEIGIRMAMGAQPSVVLRLVVGQGMRLALAGVGIGIISALALTRVMSSLLYGVSASDPLTFVVISVVLSGVALAACFVPARRATKVDPIIALRYE